ncbi:MAG TPA: peptidase M28, partial [Gemmatirosa sp.]|nr:peptidase M28 [Gemmatirosa sp.]
MRSTVLLLAAGALLVARPSSADAQSPVAPPAASTADSAADPIQRIVARLDLERYKGTIKELTRFGDRRQ